SGADDLRRDIADLAGSTAEVEDGLAWAEIRRGVSTAVVFVDDFWGQHREIARVIRHRAAEGGFCLPGPGRVPLLDDLLDVHELRHEDSRFFSDTQMSTKSTIPLMEERGNGRNTKASVRAFLHLFLMIVVSALTVMACFSCPLLRAMVLLGFSL